MEILLILLGIAIVESYLFLPPIRAALKNKFGIDVYPFIILWRRKTEAKPMRIKNRKYLKIFFTIGVVLVFLWTAVFYVFMVPAILRFLEGFAHGKAEQSPLVPLIPGITIKGIYIVYFALAASVAIAFHELLHALAARSEGVKLRSWGVGVLFIFPLAFVETDEDSFRNSKMSTRLRILGAGILANTIIALIAFLALQLVTSGATTAVLIVDIDNGWPADIAGIKAGDIILSINGTNISKISDLAQVLKPYANMSVQFIVKIFRPGEGIMEFLVRKPSTYERLGIRVTETFIRKTGVGSYIEDTLRLQGYYILQWMYIINASLAMINAAPLFITDGGKIISELASKLGLAGRALSMILQSITAILVIITISLALLTL